MTKHRILIEFEARKPLPAGITFTALWLRKVDNGAIK